MKSRNALAPSAPTIAPTEGPQGKSGHSTSRVTSPSLRKTAKEAPKLLRTSGCACSTTPLGTAMRSLFLGCEARSYLKDRSTEVGSAASCPAIAPSTIPQSSAERAIGPSLASVQLSAIAPWRLTRPYVGRNPVTPQNAEGVRIEPEVSEPMAKGTSPAATEAPGPLEDPPLQ